ncbi:MAG: 6-pyruvoyl trahydropterin synthase family protein [Planctomycetota bacterium]
MKLVRELRFHQVPDSGSRDGGARRTSNSWSGTVTGATVGHHLALRAEISGDIDRRTGYVCNIKLIDQLLASHVLNRLVDTATSTVHQIGRSLLTCIDDASSHVPPGTKLVSLSLLLSPHLRVRVVHGESTMVELTQSFEFSAAHRLYCEAFSDEENYEVFGKCANAHGHGHNYVLAVTVGGQLDQQSGSLIGVEDFDRIVKTEVIDHFDHKHLNLDCEEFRNCNPSVENIARVIFQRLDGKLEAAVLHRVRVWETPKTFAEYSGR